MKKIDNKVKIKGYRRTDGKFGLRNKVLILPCSLCASETARMAYQMVDEAAFFANQAGCSLGRRDLAVTLNTLSGIAANPNIYGTVLVGNGCEVVQASLLAQKIKEKTDKPLEVFVIRELGGSAKTIRKIVETVEKMCLQAGREVMVEADISELILGTECGGSDPTSGLVANPVVGKLSNLVVEQGGTVILSETAEMIGAEKILEEKCDSAEIKERLLSMISSYENDFLLLGENPRYGNPTPGNIAGGITTLEEKSLGCIHKAGNGKIREVIGYGQIVNEKGLVVMDTPGQDVASIVGMAAGGAQAVVFTTGHGTPTGSGIVPVIKITANAETARQVEDDIDFDCSEVLAGSKTVESAGEELYILLKEVCCGEKTKAEKKGFQDVSMARYCNFA